MPPGNQNQYEFIMSSGQKSKKPGLTLPSGNSQNQRIAIFAGLILIVIIFLFLMMSLMKSGGEDKAQYKAVVQTQNELIRVAGLASVEPSTGQAIKNTAANLQTVVTSDRQALIGTLQQKGITLKEKDLIGIPDPNTDQRLTSARAAANYNDTVLAVLNEQLVSYQAKLKQTYDKTKSQTIKDNINQAYQHTGLLQKQLSATKP